MFDMPPVSTASHCYKKQAEEDDKEMRKIILAIGIIALLIGLSTIPAGASPQSEIEQKAAGNSMTFRFAYVGTRIKNPVLTYEHVSGFKILNSSIYSNVRISGEFYGNGILSRLSLILHHKVWYPNFGDQVTIEIGRFIGQIKEVTFWGEQCIQFFGWNDNLGGLGFNVTATIYN